MRLTRFLLILAPLVLGCFFISRPIFAQTEDEKVRPENQSGEADTSSAPTKEKSTEPRERQFKVIRVDVRGNQAVSTSTILNNMRLRPGADLTQQMVNEDVKRLYGTGFFQDIRIDIEETAEGVRLIVVVSEKPVIRRIVIEGNQLLKERDIRKELGVIEGQALDEFSIKQGINKVKDRYANKGFRFVKIQYRVDTDRVTKEATLIVSITEGAKFRVGKVSFEGNQSFKPRRLLKLMKTKPRNLLLFRFGTFRDEKFEDDLDHLAAFYQANGFLDVRVSHDFEYDEAKGKIIIKIQIDEGKQYQAGRIEIKGAKILPESEIWQRLEILPGMTFSQQGLAEEMQRIRDFYFRYGYM
ncbi:MAG: hypothetical protein HY584_03605, partial [Candidatus Omnitrophica bacterium]|nr:hypothetical protein [Candidatus Omnitrophota bacterium]